MELNVLIVDNEEAIRKGLSTCIDWPQLGYRIVGQAADGIEALQLIPTLQPHIVISDIRMPGMDGLQLADELHRHHPGIRVIILTGYPDFSYAQKAISYGVVDFVLKPTSVESLRAAVEKARQQILEERSHLDVYQKLADKDEQNLALQRSAFLNELMHMQNLSRLYTYNRMAELGLVLNNYHVVRLAAEPKQSEKAASPLEQVRPVLHNLLGQNPGYFVPRGEQAAYLVICARETAALLRTLREAERILGGLLSFYVYFGLSAHHTDPMQMADAAREARRAVQFAEYTPAHRVVAYTEMPTDNSQELAGISEQLKQLKAAVEQRSLPAVENELQGIFGSMRALGASAESMRSIATVLYHLCVGLYLGDEGDEQIAARLPRLQDALQSTGPEGLEEDLLRFVREAMPAPQNADENPDEVVRQVKAYIGGHYKEDLPLEQLAALVHLSPSYLSKLFKKQTGENVSLYIQNLRIEKAKSLLSATNLKSYEVAEQVGIPDPVYFSRIFKKVTGVKPKDYRQQTEPETNFENIK